MARKFVLVLGLTTSLLLARETSAVEITPIDLDTWLSGSAGPLFHPPTSSDLFEQAPPATTALGLLSNAVYRNLTTGLYTYVHTVTPTVNNATFFNTGFEVTGFTGVAGWRFSDSDNHAGGCGGPSASCDGGDFMVVGNPVVPSQLLWFTHPDNLFNEWDALQSISFFFVSSRAPVAGANYNLTAGAGPTGTAQSFAPAAIPEPGSMVLLGSGLVALYGATRRRRPANR